MDFCKIFNKFLKSDFFFIQKIRFITQNNITYYRYDTMKYKYYSLFPF